jgi:RimJ/RimL family protein N-acetyltransferase
MAAVAKDGMPQNLVDLRMRVPEDLWAPWVILMAEGEVASMAFAARISDDGAELGLATVPKFRGRGLARLVTAAWTNLPELAMRRLFYGADHDNVASHRVITQLGPAPHRRQHQAHLTHATPSKRPPLICRLKTT